MLRNSAINLVLRAGLGLASLAFSIVSIIQADRIIETYPEFVVNIFGDTVSVAIGAILSLFMTIWIFSGRYQFTNAIIYALLFLIGIFSNITSLTYLGVAWPLLCMAIGLCIRYYPRIRIIVPTKDGGEKMKIVPIEEEIIIDQVNDHDSGDSDLYEDDDVLESVEVVETEIQIIDNKNDKQKGDRGKRNKNKKPQDLNSAGGDIAGII